MKDKVVSRFCFGVPQQPLTNVWRVVREGDGSVYFTDGSPKAFKLSVHASGIVHLKLGQHTEPFGYAAMVPPVVAFEIIYSFQKRKKPPVHEGSQSNDIHWLASPTHNHILALQMVYAPANLGLKPRPSVEQLGGPIACKLHGIPSFLYILLKERVPSFWELLQTSRMTEIDLTQNPVIENLAMFRIARSTDGHPQMIYIVT